MRYENIVGSYIRVNLDKRTSEDWKESWCTPSVCYNCAMTLFGSQSRGCSTHYKLRQRKKLTRFKDVIFADCISSRRSDYIFRTGVISIHKENIWSDKYPRLIRSHQQQWQVSCGLKFVGYSLLSAWAIGRNCLNFLVTCIRGLLEDIYFIMPMWHDEGRSETS
jgi:hypothetical protein